MSAPAVLASPKLEEANPRNNLPIFDPTLVTIQLICWPLSVMVIIYINLVQEEKKKRTGIWWLMGGLLTIVWLWVSWSFPDMSVWFHVLMHVPYVVGLICLSVLAVLAHSNDR